MRGRSTGRAYVPGCFPCLLRNEIPSLPFKVLLRATPTVFSPALQAHHEVSCHPGLALEPSSQHPEGFPVLEQRELLAGSSRNGNWQVTSPGHPCIQQIILTMDTHWITNIPWVPRSARQSFVHCVHLKNYKLEGRRVYFHWLVCSHWWEGNLKTWL